MLDKLTNNFITLRVSKTLQNIANTTTTYYIKVNQY